MCLFYINKMESNLMGVLYWNSVADEEEKVTNCHIHKVNKLGDYKI